MKEFSEYIVEKLKINKDTKVKEKEIKYLSDRYEVGNICLKITECGIGNSQKVKIEVVKISKISKTIITYEYITHNCISQSKNSDYTKHNRSDSTALNKYKYFFHSSGYSTTMIINHEDCIDILNQIKKDGMKFDFFEHLWMEGRKNKSFTRVVQFKKDAHYWDPTNDDYEELSEERLNKMINIIKGEN